MNLPGWAIEDVRQALELMLFVSDGEREQQLLKYSGTGDLRNWVRATAVRLATRMEMKRRKEAPVEPEVGARSLEAKVDDPELAFLKATHGPQFQQAFQEALAALTPRDQH